MATHGGGSWAQVTVDQSDKVFGTLDSSGVPQGGLVVDDALVRGVRAPFSCSILLPFHLPVYKSSFPPRRGVLLPADLLGRCPRRI